MSSECRHLADLVCIPTQSCSFVRLVCSGWCRVHFQTTNWFGYLVARLLPWRDRIVFQPVLDILCLLSWLNSVAYRWQYPDSTVLFAHFQTFPHSWLVQADWTMCGYLLRGNECMWNPGKMKHQYFIMPFLTNAPNSWKFDSNRQLTCTIINRHNASLKIIRTVSPFSHELTETQFFVHNRARYNDFVWDSDDDGSLADLKKDYLNFIYLFDSANYY